MEETYLYSVIVPHFNSNGLIERLLNSIPNRPDIQVIVVDDCSTQTCIRDIANKGDFARVEFVLSDSKVYAGGARNIGIERAKGEYLLFADSDDYFCATAFTYFDRYITQDHELVQFGVTSFIEGSGAKGTRHQYLLKQYRLKGLARYLSVGIPCAKLIKHDLVKRYNIRFNRVIASNDICFSAKVALLAKSKSAVSSVVYEVSENAFSLTATQTPEKSIARMQEQTKKIQLIRSLTPWHFWVIYLSRKNTLGLSYKMINVDKTISINFQAACRENIRMTPYIAKLIYRIYSVIKSNKQSVSTTPK